MLTPGVAGGLANKKRVSPAQAPPEKAGSGLIATKLTTSVHEFSFPELSLPTNSAWKLVPTSEQSNPFGLINRVSKPPQLSKLPLSIATASTNVWLKPEGLICKVVGWQIAVGTSSSKILTSKAQVSLLP